MLLEDSRGRPVCVPAHEHVDGFRDLQETAWSGPCPTPTGFLGLRAVAPAQPWSRPGHCSDYFPKHSLLLGPKIKKPGCREGPRQVCLEGGGTAAGKDRVTHRGDASQPASEQDCHEATDRQGPCMGAWGVGCPQLFEITQTEDRAICGVWERLGNETSEPGPVAQSRSSRGPTLLPLEITNQGLTCLCSANSPHRIPRC